MANLKKHRNFIMIIALIVYYVLSFLPVLRSGYMYDDILNYTAKGYAILHDMDNIWELTKNIALLWFHENGRVFFFTWYMYAFLTYIGLGMYKFMIVASTFLNGFLLGYLVKRISNNERLRWLVMLIFPILMSLDCSYHSAMYGYHIMLQLTFMYILLAVIFFDKYVQSRITKWQVISCIFLFLALGTYEVAYVLCALFFLIAFFQYRSFWTTIKKIVPQISVGCLWLALNIYARLHMTSGYAGTTIHIGKEMIAGFVKQLSGTFCLTNNIIGLNSIVDSESVFQDQIWRYGAVFILIMVLLTLILGVTGIYENHKDKTRKLLIADDRMLLFIIGIWILVGPTLLIALSARYQEEVTWGRGYLPAYISCWGMSICMALFIEWMSTKVKNKVLFLTILATIVVAIVVPNQLIGDITVNNVGNWNYIGDKLFKKADNTGMFDSLKENENIIDGTNIWSGVDQHYAYLLDYRVNAVSIYELYQMSENGLTYTDKYNYMNLQGKFRYIVMPNEVTALMMADCEHTDIWMGDQNNVCMSTKSDSIYVFVPTEQVYTSVIVPYDDGRTEEIMLDDSVLHSSSNEGKVFWISLTEKVNVHGIILK